MDQEYKPKISMVELILLVLFAIIADVLDIIPGLNDIVALIFTPAIQGYLWLKGIKGVYTLVGNLLSFIPGVSIVPLHTVTVSITAWIDRHPEGVAAQAIQKTPQIKNPKGALAAKAIIN